ncbi:MAG: GAF domain-containing protein [Anaerolineales bacterium]
MTQQPPSKSTEYTPFVQYLLVYAVYTPIFAVINTLGFLAIYLAGVLELIEPAPPQFFGVAASSLLLAVSILPSRALLQRGRLHLGQGILAGGASIFLALSNLFWSGLTPFLYVIVWLPGILQLIKVENRKQWVAPILAGLAGTLVLTVTELWAPFERMPFNQGAALLGFWFFVFALTVLVSLVLITQVIPFRTLSSRLLTASLALVISPILIITLVSGIQSYQQEQSRTLTQLDTINTLIENQINQAVLPIQQDLGSTLQNTAMLQRLEYILTVRIQATAYQSNYNQVLQYFKDVLREKGRYQEFFVVDPKGNIVLSTDEAFVGSKFPDARFLQRAANGPIMAVVDNRFNAISRFGVISVMAAQPLYNPFNGDFIGIVGLRSSFEDISQIVASNAGLKQSGESYLVDENYRRLTPTLSLQTDLHTLATERAIEQQGRGSGNYDNRDGKSVSGAYRWLPSLRVALVSEVPAEVAVAGSIGIITANILLGLFTVFIAIVAVFLTSVSISMPITKLSADVKQIAEGNFAVRSNIERADEIGALATSFNNMAAELQSMVTGLEARIAERTQNIAQQALQLRAAAEIARDTTAARDLNALLERSTQLIVDRFGFYHTGIFLLDPKREYAILRSSPTEAGKVMLQNNHKLRVGEEGIVGYVAATGDARIALDTGADAIYFKNPPLPNTRSEIALPLKVNDVVIGVLDVQSDRPNAFDQNDLTILQVMADQIAAAIDRTRLLEERESTLARMEQAYQQFTEASWRKLTTQRLTTLGYRFQGTELTPIAQCPPEARDALERGQVIVLERDKAPSERPYSTVAVPVKLRGKTIGVLNIKVDSDTVSNDLVVTLEETASRFAIALENSRLIAETQVRADRERAIAEVTGRIGANVETEDILRATAQELGKMLDDARVTFRLKTPTSGKSN